MENTQEDNIQTEENVQIEELPKQKKNYHKKQIDHLNNIRIRTLEKREKLNYKK